MRRKDQQTIASASAALIAAGIVGLNYMRIVRVEVRKRQKIREWKHVNQGCLQNYRNTLTQKINDPNTSSDEFWRVYEEETEFLNIITRRPMY